MELTQTYISNETTYTELFDEFRNLLLSDKPEDKAAFDLTIKTFGAQLIFKLFQTPLLAEFSTKEHQTTFCIVTSQACKTLEIEDLMPVFSQSIAFILDPNTAIQPAKLYASTFQSFARICQIKQIQLPEFDLNLIFHSIIADIETIQNEQEIQLSTSSKLELLSTFLVFDAFKIQFVNLNGLLIFAQFLAATTDEALANGILGLIHSLIFNLNDVGQRSIFDLVAPKFAEISLNQLIQTVIEKNFTTTQFNILMIFHGCLIPQTKDLANLQNATFAVENFQNNDLYIQIMCETLIKFTAMSTEKIEISQFLANNSSLIQNLMKTLDISQNQQICGIVISLLQITAVTSPIQNSYQQFNFSLQPIMKISHIFASKLVNQQLSSAVQNLENCYVALTYFVETRGSGQWEAISVGAEAQAVLQLAESLSGVQGLLVELPGLCALISRLCACGSYLSQAQVLLGERFGVFYAFLVDFAVMVKGQGKNGYGVVLGVLKGLSKIQGQIQKVEVGKIVSLMDCFDSDVDEEFEDVLGDLIEGYGKNVPVEVQKGLEAVLKRMEQ